MTIRMPSSMRTGSSFKLHLPSTWDNSPILPSTDLPRILGNAVNQNCDILRVLLSVHRDSERLKTKLEPSSASVQHDLTVVQAAECY